MDRCARASRTVLLLSAEHATAVAEAGGLVGAWPSGVTNATLGDFVDEIVRLVDLLGADHVAIESDLDANYRPVVAEHGQFAAIAACSRSAAPPETSRQRGLH